MSFNEESTSNMAVQAAPRRILPKRARKDTSYYPSESESENETDEDGTYDSDEEATQPSKRAKLNTTVTKSRELPRKRMFPFMSLPSEVKNMIYNYALTSECEIPLVSRSKGYRHTIELGDTNSFQSFRRRAYHAWDGAYIPRRVATIPIIRPSFAPTIIALNREIHAQAQPILYGANAFALEDPKALLAFCANIGPKNCAYLQEVSLKHWGNTVVRRAMCHPAFAMLASAVNLKSLNLDCCIHWGAGSGTARQFFRDGHNWLEAVGTKEGRRDPAVDLIQLGMQHIDRPRVGNVSTEHTTNKEKLEEMTDAFQSELRRLLKA